MHAQVNFEHFPPLFVRFLAATLGRMVPPVTALQLLDEGTIDSFLRNIRSIAASDFTVTLEP